MGIVDLPAGVLEVRKATIAVGFGAAPGHFFRRDVAHHNPDANTATVIKCEVFGSKRHRQHTTGIVAGEDLNRLRLNVGPYLKPPGWDGAPQ